MTHKQVVQARQRLLQRLPSPRLILLQWRTGCEGRISVTKRRHGLGRCRYKGEESMERWVGLGVISDNLINIGRVIARRQRR